MCEETFFINDTLYYVEKSFNGKEFYVEFIKIIKLVPSFGGIVEFM